MYYRNSWAVRKRVDAALPFSTPISDQEPARVAPAPRRRQPFSFPAKRRREIVLHARHVGAAETEDFSRWLIAWVWHNPKAKDQIWSVMEAAKSMGGKITEAEASAVTEEASITRKHLTADNLARFLGVTYEQRQALRLTTIGSVNVGKRARKELRRRRDRLHKERKRRAAGMRPQSESLSATKPWGQLGMSRAAWYRRNKRRNETGETTLSAAIFLSLPLELRLLALGLQSEGPSANVITANDPRMVARMAANGGGPVTGW
jgi:hypothetical protein